jgi:hypothetical protein
MPEPVHRSQPRARARLLALVLAPCLLLLCAGRLEAHPHNTIPPVDVTITIQGAEILVLLDMEKWQIVAWGEPVSRYVDLESAVPAAKAIQKLQQRLEVAVDGVVVEPVLRTLGDPPFDEKVIAPRVKLAVVYPATKPPSTVRLTWKDFFGIHWENEAQVPMLIEADSQIDTATLTKGEPQYTWHRRAPAAFRTAAAPSAPPPEGSRWPVVPLALGVLALGISFVPPLRRLRGAPRWAPACALLAAGAVLYANGVGSVETPWGRSLPPTEKQARDVFTSLLSNVYRSMDAKGETAKEREEKIYALLAASVEKPILDDLYGDIYESLVLRDQHGMVARVEDVTVTETAIRFPENGSTTQFTAAATWDLKAAVSHLGHTHKRQNLYRADVVVRNDGGAWRIASVLMRERMRLDNGKGGLLDKPKALEPTTGDEPR